MMRSEWENNEDWRVRTADKRVYIIREHNWSFAAWEISRIEEKIKEKSLVVHVDSHLDDVSDGVLVENLLEVSSTNQIIEVCDNVALKIDNFIWSSLARGTIEEVIYVSRDDQEVTTLNDLREGGAESELILSKLPSNCNYRHQRFHSIDSFLESFNKDTFAEFVSNRSVILDLDLDVFNESDDFEPILIPMHEVREKVEGLLKLYPWDLITIAISPYYCGGDLEAELILENVLKVMNINLLQTQRW